MSHGDEVTPGDESPTMDQRKTYNEEQPSDRLATDLTPEEIDDLVLYEVVEDHIAIITLNRPDKRNAMLSPHSFVELTKKLRRAEDDDEVKVVVLIGKGDSFCAGVDLRRTPVESAGLQPGQRLPQSRRMHNIQSANAAPILNLDKTVIAAVDGPAVAAGFQYAMEADMVIATERARFGEPEARIGFAGLSPTFPILALKAGVNRARSMVLTGRLVGAEEMKDWGVVESVVPPDQLMDEALRYARMVAWHSTDNLMLGRRSLRLFWDLMGMAAQRTWFSVAHPLFTNVVWREDEFNFLRERNERGMKGALVEMNRQWEDMGF